MGCIYYFFTWPLYFMYYMIIVIAYTIYYGAIICYHIFMFFIKIIMIIYNNISQNKTQRNYIEDYDRTYKTNNDFSTKNTKTSWKEEKFEKEADLWELSKEDRKIAKEERMSPADFIEAEERDDDELFTDEWE